MNYNFLNESIHLASTLFPEFKDLPRVFYHRDKDRNHYDQKRQPNCQEKCTAYTGKDNNRYLLEYDRKSNIKLRSRPYVHTLYVPL